MLTNNNSFLFATSAETKNTKKEKRKNTKNRLHTNASPEHDIENVRK